MKLRGFIAFALALLMIFGSAYTPAPGLAEDGVSTPSNMEMPQETVAEETPAPAEEPSEEAATQPTAEPAAEAPEEDAAPSQAPEEDAAPAETVILEDAPAETAVPKERRASIGQAVVALQDAGGTLPVYADASEGAQRVAVLDNGETVFILAREDEWTNIRTVCDVEGYVKSEYLQSGLAAAETPLPEESAEENQPKREIAVRREANGMSEVILTVTDVSEVSILAVEGDWVKVAVSGVVGYIYIDDIGVPQSTDAPRTEIRVTIFTSRRAVMTPGETVTLTSKLEGDLDGLEIRYQWECDKGQGFEAVPGANDSTYAFAASVETLSYDWRLTVYYR